MRMIVRTTPNPARAEYVAYLQAHLPGVELCVDRNYDRQDLPGYRKSALNMVAAMRMAGYDPALHLEDDVVLTVDFVRKVQAALVGHEGEVVQFFSMRGADLTEGSRYDRHFRMAQCFYTPAGVASAIARFYPTWRPKSTLPDGDVFVDDWLKANGLRYWVHVPSLVQHRPARSLINAKRSTARQSKTFADPQL